MKFSKLEKKFFKKIKAFKKNGYLVEIIDGSIIKKNDIADFLIINEDGEKRFILTSPFSQCSIK